MISAPLPFYLYQQIGSYRSQDGAVTALILLLLCFLLFTVIENYRGEMLKLTDITWLYHHLPMRFSLTVEQGEQVAILGPNGAGKYPAEFDRRFSDASQRFADYRRR